MTHTPGPWKVTPSQRDNGARTIIESESGDMVAHINSASAWGDVPGIQYPHDWHNARLIAAAPDLLAALKALVRHDQAADRRERLDNCYELKRAIEIIAKTEKAS